MARMIPERSNAELKRAHSSAEAKVYRALRGLPDSVVVIHGMDTLLPDRVGTLRQGEADFVILDPVAGMIVLEVKGGGIEHDAVANQWWSTNRENERNKINDPYRQARERMNDLVHHIRAHPRWCDLGGKFLPAAYGVLFPNLDDISALIGPARPVEITGGRRELANIDVWLRTLVDSCRTSARRTSIGIDGRDVLEKILCASLEVNPRLGDWFAGVPPVSMLNKVRSFI